MTGARGATEQWTAIKAQQEGNSMIAAVLTASGLVALTLVVGLALRSKIGESPERTQLRARTSGLTRSERWHVLRAVAKGRAVNSPPLAAAAVARARYIRAFGRRVTRGRWRWVLPIIAVLQIVLTVSRLLEDRPLDVFRWTSTASSFLVGIILLSGPWLWRRASRRADRAEQLNLGLIYEQQSR